MGAGAISGLSQNETRELSQRTNFSQKQIRLLWKRFSALDHTDRGFISAVEFKYLPELICNPLADRILEVIRLKEQWYNTAEEIVSGRSKSRALPGDIDFRLFVITMDAFHPKKVTLVPM
jgi:Ca2+-binding EF-hand superfamily protein